jgi:hypothetical protein
VSILNFTNNPSVEMCSNMKTRYTSTSSEKNTTQQTKPTLQCIYLLVQNILPKYVARATDIADVKQPCPGHESFNLASN